MDTVEEAEAAIANLHNAELAGKPITVEKVNPFVLLLVPRLIWRFRLGADALVHPPLASILEPHAATIVAMAAEEEEEEGIVKIDMPQNVLTIPASMILAIHEIATMTDVTMIAVMIGIVAMMNAVATMTPVDVTTTAVAGMKMDVEVAGTRTDVGEGGMRNVDTRNVAERTYRYCKNKTVYRLRLCCCSVCGSICFARLDNGLLCEDLWCDSMSLSQPDTQLLVHVIFSFPLIWALNFTKIVSANFQDGVSLVHSSITVHH
jgi:hypothetical protein